MTGPALLPRPVTPLALAVLAALGGSCGSSVPTAPPLARVARSSGCVERHGLPDPRCTPGAVDPRVSASTLAATICRPGYARRVRPTLRVSEAIKRERLAAYGKRGARLRDFELDHLVPLELGGAPASVANLWPEPLDGPRGARVKDRLENTLHAAVCEHRADLRAAQLAIASDWTAAYPRIGLGAPVDAVP